MIFVVEAGCITVIISVGIPPVGCCKFYAGTVKKEF